MTFGGAALTPLHAAPFLDDLNPAQRRAVEAPDGPVLIFAGAGSGKTRVLTSRIAHVVATGRARPAEICAVTFTNKAAREMRARLEVLLGDGGVSGMWLGTFHSIGARILRVDGDAIDVPRDYVIYDEADRQQALRRAMAAAGVDEKRHSVAQIGHAISAAKNEMLDAADYKGSAAGYFAAQVAPVYTAYERAMRDAAALDFDDLLLRTVQLLRDVPPVREHYQERFRHIFVDEYQDTNRSQYVMVHLLAERHGNITVVGDDDQSIYGWRGADVRNILSFERDHPDALVITLEQNYRSSQVILDAAHAVIRHNPDRAAKQLWTERDGGEAIRLLSVYDEQEEALAIASEIEALVATGYSLSDCAVLYRTNAQSRAFEDVLLRRGIPYRLVGGLRFYERREVKDVLAYLRLVANPRDVVSFARIVNVPRRKIGDRTVEELERIARRRETTPLEAVRSLEDGESLGAAARTALHGFLELIEQLRAAAETQPLPQLLEVLLDRTGYRAMLDDGTPEGVERLANVMELVGLAGEYADAPSPDGLRQFLENVALVSDVDALDTAMGAAGRARRAVEASGVTLITLHQVKGLEFPVVFMAGLEEGLLPHVRALEEGDGGVAEERRLMYVGITRAQQRLYLSHAFRRHLYGQPQTSPASRFLGDVPAELLVVPRRGNVPVADPRAAGAARAAVHAHAVRPNPVEVAPQRFAEGMRVGHPRYGEGTILKSTMLRSGEEVVIRFDTAGVRIFVVADSALTVL